MQQSHPTAELASPHSCGGSVPVPARPLSEKACAKAERKRRWSVLLALMMSDGLLVDEVFWEAAGRPGHGRICPSMLEM